MGRWSVGKPVSKWGGDRLNTFRNRYLWRILKTIWPRIVGNIELHRRAGMSSVTSSMIRARRSEWIGHVSRKEPSDDRRITLSWLPQ